MADTHPIDATGKISKKVWADEGMQWQPAGEQESGKWQAGQFECFGDLLSKYHQNGAPFGGRQVGVSGK